MENPREGGESKFSTPRVGGLGREWKIPVLGRGDQTPMHVMVYYQSVYTVSLYISLVKLSKIA